MHRRAIISMKGLGDYSYEEGLSMLKLYSLLKWGWEEILLKFIRLWEVFMGWVLKISFSMLSKRTLEVIDLNYLAQMLLRDVCFY